MPDDPKPWSQAWQEALYGPGGFYRTSAPAGHFATSAQGIPGGGELLAGAVVALARQHDCDHVIDLGAGRGELLTRIREIAPELQLTGVDVLPPPAGLPVDGWLTAPGGPELPPELNGIPSAVVFAQEWLDVVPAAVAEQDADGVWRVITVAADGTETLGPAVGGAELDWLRRWIPGHVHRAETGLSRDRAWTDLLGRIDTGVAVAVDYGHTRASWPEQGTLTGYQHGRQVPPVPDGTCDLTAHVAWDSLLEASRGAVESAQLSSQRAALPALTRLNPPLAAGATHPHPAGRAAGPDGGGDPAEYLQNLARQAAFRALTTPGGLGDFGWLICPH